MPVELYPGLFLRERGSGILEISTEFRTFFTNGPPPEALFKLFRDYPDLIDPEGRAYRSLGTGLYLSAVWEDPLGKGDRRDHPGAEVLRDELPEDLRSPGLLGEHREVLDFREVPAQGTSKGAPEVEGAQKSSGSTGKRGGLGKDKPRSGTPEEWKDALSRAHEEGWDLWELGTYYYERYQLPGLRKYLERTKGRKVYLDMGPAETFGKEYREYVKYDRRIPLEELASRSYLELLPPKYHYALTLLYHAPQGQLQSQLQKLEELFELEELILLFRIYRLLIQREWPSRASPQKISVGDLLKILEANPATLLVLSSIHPNMRAHLMEQLRGATIHLPNPSKNWVPKGELLSDPEVRQFLRSFLQRLSESLEDVENLPSDFKESLKLERVIQKYLRVLADASPANLQSTKSRRGKRGSG